MFAQFMDKSLAWQKPFGDEFISSTLSRKKYRIKSRTDDKYLIVIELQTNRHNLTTIQIEFPDEKNEVD